MKETEVIRRPIITEKTTIQREDGRTIVFEVAMRATKVDIRRQGQASGAVRGPAPGLEEGVCASASR